VVKLGRPRHGDSGPLATILDLPSVRTTAEAAKAVSSTPCASCGQCCRGYVVPVCGFDVWRISRELRVDPAAFVVAWQEEEPGTDGFRLEPEGPLFKLVLDKRSWSRQRSACVFLMGLPGGQDRCGIYGQRPVACRSYPMLLVSGGVVLRDDPLCPPGAWSSADVRDPAWREALQQAAMQYDVYKVVVDHWNARVRDGSLAAGLGFADYYRYVLTAYDALAQLEADEATLRARAATWRTPGAGPVEALPWQRHLDRVREVLGQV
jgi:Fe-S-cluster containining protein